MKKLLLTLTFLTLLVSQAFAGNLGDISNINNAKCTTDYGDAVSVEEVDTVIFGSYPQSDASGNTKEPVEWIVLEKQGDKALLLSKYILDCKKFNDDDVKISWNNCTLNNWLNNTFVNNAFDGNEQNIIVSLNNTKVFCLSLEDINKYFNSDDVFLTKVATRGTNFAKNSNGGVQVFSKENMEIDSDKLKFDGNSSYWLSSIGTDDCISFVNWNGYVNNDGVGCDNSMGVRPAIWVSINNAINETVVQNSVESILGGNVNLEGASIIQHPDGSITIGGEAEKGDILLKESEYDNKNETFNDVPTDTLNAAVASDELSENESYHILSDKILNKLESEAIFTATYNINDLRWINVNKEKDGFLGMFGNDIYYVHFEYKNRREQEDLIADYDLKHPTEDDTDIEDCLGNAIRRIPMSEWSSLKIKMYSKEAAENVVNFINDGNDYTIYFLDTLIKSTGKLEADPNTALFDIEIPAKMISHTTPIQSRIPNSRLELNDLGVEIADGVNVWVNIGDEAYYVQICTKNYDFNREYSDKISDYYFGHKDTGFNVIDSLGHNIKLFYYGGFGNYYLYTDSMQDAKEISSYLNTSKAKYKIYFYDKVLESTGVHNDIDKSKAKFNVKFSKDMIEWASPEKTREMKAVIDPMGGMEILGIPFGVSLGQDLYEVTVHLKKDFNPLTVAQINYYDIGFMNIGQKIFDNYGHKIIRAYDGSFDQFFIYADTYEEAEQISTELNDSNCDYTLYYFDNVIESTGRYKPDASKADLTIEILDKNNRYTTAEEVTKKELSIGWDDIGYEDGETVYFVRTHLAKKLENSDKISKDHKEIYDSLGHKILSMEYASGHDYYILAESFNDAKEIASYMNMTDSVYKLYFYK